MNVFLSQMWAYVGGFFKSVNLGKGLAVVLLISAIPMLVFGQSAIKGQITGKVLDAGTNLPVELTTISLFKSGTSNPFAVSSSNRMGDFNFTDVPAGEYRLSVRYLGYQPKTIDHVVIGVKNLSVSLGKILLSSAENMLGVVTIQSKTPVLENKVDKLVYNAAADLTSQGGTATDILSKVPMVSVDVDGNVELQGNANVRFLINGKPSNIYGSSITDVLQSIPASQIQSIEVISSPGAKYDAAGTAGIINVVLKKNKIKGVNGSVNLSAGTRVENGAMNLNVRNNNLGVGAFFSGNDQLNSSILNTADRLSSNATKDTMTRYIQKRNTPFKRNGYQSGINLDWNVSPKDEFTASIGYNHILSLTSGRTSQDQQTFLSSGTIVDDIQSERITSYNYGENAVNWSGVYKKTFRKEGRELDVLYSSSYSKSIKNDSQITDYLGAGYPTSGIQSNNPGNDRETDISIDYTEPIAKGFQLETGFKTVLESINNAASTDTLLNNGSFINNSGQTYGFNFNRDIYAGYVSSSFSIFNDFLNGKIGIRFEHTVTSSDLPGIRIPMDNIWAPDLAIQHKLDEGQSLKFAYTYRIERPDYGDMNPFLDVVDPHNIDTGNPLLKNETGHKFELGYSKAFENNSSIYIGGFYNYNNNDIQSFTTFYPVFTANGSNFYNVSLAKRTNIGSQTTLGANISGSAVVSEKFSLRANVFLLSKNNLVPGSPSVGGFSYSGNLNATYQLRSDLVLEAFGSLTSKRTDFQSIRPGSYYYTFAAKKLLFNKKASFGFITTNPFNQYMNQYSSAYGTGFTQTNSRQRTVRSFGVTLSYKFGTLKIKEKVNEEKGLAVPD